MTSKYKKPPCERYGNAYLKYTRLGKQYCRRKPYYNNSSQPSLKNIHNTMKEIKKSINELKTLNIKVNLHKTQHTKLPPPPPKPPSQPQKRTNISNSTQKYSKKQTNRKRKGNIQAELMKELKNKLAKIRKI